MSLLGSSPLNGLNHILYNSIRKIVRNLDTNKLQSVWSFLHSLFLFNFFKLINYTIKPYSVNKNIFLSKITIKNTSCFWQLVRLRWHVLLMSPFFVPSFWRSSGHTFSNLYLKRWYHQRWLSQTVTLTVCKRTLRVTLLIVYLVLSTFSQAFWAFAPMS